MNKDFSVAILDSDKDSNRNLKKILVANFSSLKAVSIFEESQDFINSLNRNSYDLVFLSDCINQQSNSGHLTTLIGLIVPNIILLNSCIERVLNVELSIFKGVLIKPIKDASVVNIMQSFLDQDHLFSQSKQKDKIQIKTHNQSKIIKINDLAYVSSVNNSCSIYLFDSMKINSIERIGKLELRLPSNFIRIHKSFLVNIDAIVSILYAGVDMFVVLSDGSQLPVAYRKRALVRKTLSLIVS